tara:strand:+ start:180 stop:1109 length:930 start_codon:yes stop_codon:yes gene_type:complete
VKKKFLIILLYCIISNSLFAQDKIFISLTINNVPITNLDIMEEANYLSALNPGIQKINKKEVMSIAKASLIKEKIKEQELIKHFNLNEENKYVDNIIKQIYSSLNIKNKEEFKNYLINFDIELKNLIYKINIEARWNELIHNYYSSKFDIDYDKLKNKLKSQKNEMVELYLLSEILFNIENKSELDIVYNKIKLYISNNNFESAAKIYSLSNTAKSGGSVGWIKKNTLSNSIIKEIESLKINQISKPIAIPGGYLILKINNRKKEKAEEKNFEDELKKLIRTERDKKLNQFSIIHYSKIKKNTEIVYEK